MVAAKLGANITKYPKNAASAIASKCDHTTTHAPNPATNAYPNGIPHNAKYPINQPIIGLPWIGNNDKPNANGDTNADNNKDASMVLQTPHCSQ